MYPTVMLFDVPVVLLVMCFFTYTPALGLSYLLPCGMYVCMYMLLLRKFLSSLLSSLVIPVTNVFRFAPCTAPYGRAVATARVYPSAAAQGISIFNHGQQPIELVSAVVYSMETVNVRTEGACPVSRKA